jgi:hypothetical protein
MNSLARKILPGFKKSGYRTMVLVSLLALAGCGGDSGIDIGGGQSADPVLVDYPLFYVKRPLPLADDGELLQMDVRELLPVEFGADLYMRDRAAAGAPETNLTAEITGGFGDIRDVSVSYDAARVLFSMRAPIDPDANDEDQPTWNIWEYVIAEKRLRRVFSADLDVIAEEGHDIGPQYLPDGRIIFSSTRQNQSVAKLTDQGKPQFAALDETRNEPAFVLHVMNDDGTDLEQISFGQSHDLYPTVLDNGRIMFSRWDATGNNDGIALYTANPDGTGLQLLYGADSHSTGSATAGVGANSTVQFLKPKELLDGRILALLAPFSGTTGGGDLVVIDAAAYVNNAQPVALNAGATGPAQTPATTQQVSTLPGISIGGRFTSAWPLWDGSSRILVSYTLCRLQAIPAGFDPVTDPEPPADICSAENLADPTAVAAAPAYGIWSVDVNAGEMRPIVLPEAGVIFTDVVVAETRSRPQVILDKADAGFADTELLNDDAGILHIRSVYDFDGVDDYGYAVLADPAATAADDRPARFVRVYKAVGIPDEDTLDFDDSAFGVSNANGMREIIGYAPVEPDGSVMVKVPADVPLAIDVLDSRGQRIFPRHQNWLQVRPGEVRECNGCHDPGLEGVSHGRDDSFTAVNQGAPGNGYEFPNTSLGTSADAGETMAQTRVRQSCYDDCAVRDLSIDLIYEDVWTDPDVRPADMPYSLAYADIVDTPLPERFNCVPWTIGCRVIINYEQHIQPLWEVPRDAINPDPLAANKCIDCHALRDAANVFIDPDSRGQLELTSNPSAAEANHFTSYRELLSGDTLEALIDDTVQELLVDSGQVDVDGNPIFVPINIGSPLSSAGAAARPAFFTRFTDPGSHQGWLSAAELRLIAEWLDLGAQYFNDPFNEDVPVN